jgi:hypothetical protein
MLVERKRKLALNLLATPAFSQENYLTLTAGVKK